MNTNMDIKSILDEVSNNPIYINLLINIHELKNENELLKKNFEEQINEKNKNLQKKYDILEEKYDKLKEKIKKRKADEEEKKRKKKEKQQAKEDERLRQEKQKEAEKERKFNEYFEERIIKSDIETIQFGKGEVYDDFKIWFGDHYGRWNSNYIIGKELYEFLNKKIGPPHKNRLWFGYKINYNNVEPEQYYPNTIIE